MAYIAPARYNSKPISLYPLTPEEAMKKLLEAGAQERRSVATMRSIALVYLAYETQRTWQGRPWMNRSLASIHGVSVLLAPRVVRRLMTLPTL